MVSTMPIVEKTFVTGGTVSPPSSGCFPSPEQIESKGKDYRIESSKNPIGWPQEDLDLALRMGYSKAGLQNLRPSSEHWTLDMLIKNIITHSPDVLDPLLKGLQDCYALGLTDSTAGYVPDPALLARRA